jgi:hypothetical protein
MPTNWREVQYFFSASKKKQLAKTIEKSVRRFVFLLANPEFYSHLASWRVVIRTPANTHN